MHVGVPSVIALLWVMLISGCAGNEIAPAESAAPAPGDSAPVAALYAAPPNGAFLTVGDVTADIVGPDDVPFDATFLGYGYAAELVTPFDTTFIDHDNATELAPRDEEVPGRAAAPVLAGPEMMAPPAHDSGWDSISAPPDAK